MFITLTLGFSALASESIKSRCKIRYNVLIKESENDYNDYYECSMGIDKPEALRPKTIRLKNITKKQCEDKAKELVGQEDKLEYINSLLPGSLDPLYDTCYGKIYEILRVKYRRRK